jgi:hypothetical protein
MVSTKAETAPDLEPLGSVFLNRKREWAKEYLAVLGCSSHHSLQGCGPPGLRSPTQNSLTSPTEPKDGKAGVSRPTRALEKRTAVSRLERISRSSTLVEPAGFLQLLITVTVS